jgi:hypothetical protein
MKRYTHYWNVTTVMSAILAVLGMAFWTVQIIHPFGTTLAIYIYVLGLLVVLGWAVYDLLHQSVAKLGFGDPWGYLRERYWGPLLIVGLSAFWPWIGMGLSLLFLALWFMSCRVERDESSGSSQAESEVPQFTR